MTGPLNRPRAMRCIVELALLAAMGGLLYDALRPSFAGGRFVVLTLGFNVALAAIVLLRDAAGALGPEAASDRRPAAEANPHLPSETGGAANWTIVARCFLTLAGYFAAVTVLGCVVGMTATAWGVLRWHVGLSQTRALAGAALIGIVVPVGFSLALGVLLWPGLVPELLPGWIGGGVPPAL